MSCEWRSARKRPVVVSWREVKPKTLIRIKMPERKEIWGEIIETLEGELEGIVGRDYIIKGVEGEIYPIRKDIFHKTYEVIE